MQVIGLPCHIIRNGRGGVASSRGEDPKYRSPEKTRRRRALARSHAAGLTAEQAAKAAGIPRALSAAPCPDDSIYSILSRLGVRRDYLAVLVRLSYLSSLSRNRLWNRTIVMEGE
jgi:hypothetical protein